MGNRHILWVALQCALIVACGDGGSKVGPLVGPLGFAEDGGRAVDWPPGASPVVTLTPPDTGDGWDVSTPEAENINSDSLQGTLDRLLTEGSGGVDSVVVVRNDRLVAEAYYNGYDRETIHDVRSVTKSITSALTGIAIDRGLVSIDDSIAQTIPDFETYPDIDDRKRSIRISHLLNMQSGMDCDDTIASSPGNESQMYRQVDWVRFALGIPMVAEPGERMSYCSAGVLLLGHIIASRSGVKLEQFAAEQLFGPLGVQNVRWLHSPLGVTNANSTFQIRPRDAAKFGSLYLNAGTWKGLPVVPQSWIERSFTSTGTMSNGDEYGYLWWKKQFSVRGALQDGLFASGNGGNFIFVLPDERLVVVITASNYDRNGPSFGLMSDEILAAVK